MSILQATTRPSGRDSDLRARTRTRTEDTRRSAVCAAGGACRCGILVIIKAVAPAQQKKSAGRTVVARTAEGVLLLHVLDARSSFRSYRASARMSIILIQHAESGASLQLQLPPDASVGALSAALIPFVPAAQQILLLDGLKLEDERALGEYGLPVPDPRERPIFLFSRRSLSQSAPLPEKQPLAPLALETPTELATPPRPGAEAASPLVRALLDYERHFCLHHTQARHIAATGRRRLDASERCLAELLVQGAAERVAVANLRDFAAQLTQRYTEFQARYAEIVPQQAELVRTFEGDVQALRDVALDPAVAALEGWPEGATLLDACGERGLRAWLADCQHNTDHLMSKAAQFAQDWGDLQAGVQAAEDQPIAGAPPEVSTRLSSAAELLTQQATIADGLEADERDVRNLVDAQLKPDLGASLDSARLLEECGSLESKNNTHSTSLVPQLVSLDDELRSVQEAAADAKHAGTLRLFHRLRAIALLQTQIVELRNKLVVYASLLNRVHAYCAQLSLMQRLPTTYDACIDEILRRHRTADHALSQMRAAAESLAATREEEVTKRDGFMRTHGALLPRGLPALLTLMKEAPILVEVSANAASDTRLADLANALDGRSTVVVSEEAAPASAAESTVAEEPVELTAYAAADVEAAPAPAAEEAAGDAESKAAAEASNSVDQGAEAVTELPLTLPPAAASAPAADADDDDDSPHSKVAPPPPNSTPVEMRSPVIPRPMIARSLSADRALNRRGEAARSRPQRHGDGGDLWTAIAALDSQQSANVPLGGGLGGGIIGSSEAIGSAPGSFNNGSAGASGSGVSQPEPARRVLTDPDRLPGKLSDLSAALEALGTPLDGVPVEVASQLQSRVGGLERTAQELRKQCASHSAARAKAEKEVEAQRLEMERMRKELAKLKGEESGTQDEEKSGEAAEGGEGGGEGNKDADAAAKSTDDAAIAPPVLAVECADASAASATSVSQAAATSSTSLTASIQPLRREMGALEASHSDLAAAQEMLLGSVKVAMSCLPPPGPLRKSPTPSTPPDTPPSDAVANGGGDANEGGATAVGSSSSVLEPPEGGGASGEERSEGNATDTAAGSALLSTVQRISSDLCSSARQAAHANARLGHAMATEREAHRQALATSNKRISYLAADVNARLLFIAQPSAHASHHSTGGVAFGAVMLPTLRGGLPSHWLSSESVESLRRWCEDEGKLPLQKLKYVVGRVVHVAGPFEVVAGGGGGGGGSMTASSTRTAIGGASAPEAAAAAAPSAASAGDAQPDTENVYNLPVGEHYYVVHAEMVLQHRWSQ